MRGYNQEPRVSTFERNGCKVTSTWRPGGYSGDTDYEIEGAFDDVTTEVNRIIAQWPPAGYGTWFNWPPGKVNFEGKPITHRAPTDLGNGRWIARGNHSNSCE